MGLHTMTDHSISEKIEYKYLSFINKVFLVVHIGFLLVRKDTFYNKEKQNHAEQT